MPYQFRHSDLPKLDLEQAKGSAFLAWKKKWAAYRDLSQLAEEEMATQIKAFNLCLTDETATIVENLGLPEDADIDTVITAIEDYVKGHINESVERKKFRQRKQQFGETVDNYMVTLRNLAKTCNF